MFETEGWVFRCADAGDAKAVRELVRAAYGGYVARMRRESKPMTADYDAAIRNHQVWVLFDSATLLAVLELIAEPDAFILENIAVANDLQGQGVGGRLLAFAEIEAQRQGYDEIQLYTNSLMGTNVALYAGRGYTETRREPLGAGEVVYMSKKLKK